MKTPRPTLARGLVTALLSLLLPLSAAALMPPHVRSVEPAPGSTLTARTLTVQGYTLGVGHDDLATLKGADGRAIELAVDTACTWVGEGTEPGARQQKCTMTVRIVGDVQAGEALTLTLLGDAHAYTVGPKGLPPLGGEAGGAPASAPTSAPTSQPQP
jgi:hypothetical protein